MPASKKTEILGLSLWEGTDKPRRLDFVDDNNALESILGGHITDAQCHLSEEEKKRVDSPIEVRAYTGNGTERRSVVFEFSPRAVIVFAQGHGASEYNGTYTRHYAAFGDAAHASCGLEMSSIQVTVRQDRTEPGANGSFSALNESGVDYVILAIR